MRTKFIIAAAVALLVFVVTIVSVTVVVKNKNNKIDNNTNNVEGISSSRSEEEDKTITTMGPVATSSSSNEIEISLASETTTETLTQVAEESRENTKNPSTSPVGTIRIAYVGNTFINSNNLPNLIREMLLLDYAEVVDDDRCSLKEYTWSVWPLHNCPEWFNGKTSSSLEWDYVILQADEPEQASVPDERGEFETALRTDFAPLFFGSNNTSRREFPETILLGTPAASGEELGWTYEEYIGELKKGYEQYANVLNEEASILLSTSDHSLIPTQTKIADSGEAHLWLYQNNPELWRKLYDEGDQYSPSPYGTWLQACVLYISITGKMPPVYNSNWIKRFARGKELPTEEEAMMLREIASRIAGLLTGMSTERPTPMPSLAPTTNPTKALKDPLSGNSNENDATLSDVYTKDSISIAYFGNSFTFYNACPWLLDKMLKMEYVTVKYVQCLEGGADLESLAYDSCPDWFRTDGSPNPQDWDFVILQDQSRWPAYIDTRSSSIDSLKSLYAPMLFGEDQATNQTISQEFPVPVLMQTPAYKKFGLFGTESLGDFDSFTDLVAEGYQAYADVLNEAAAMASGMDDLEISRIAANGEAYRWLYHNNQELWEKLYKPDNYHPSEYGTWLLACTLYITMTGKEPPTFDPTGWGWQSNVNVTLPTEDEAELLRKVAIQTMGLSKQPVAPTPTESSSQSPTESPSITKPTNKPVISLPGDVEDYDEIPPDVYTKDSISIAYFGDSNTFHNSCPWLLDKMLKTEYSNVRYSQCLEEGANLRSLTYSNCPDWFNTDGSPNPQNWDFVILQDQSRWAADLDTRSFSVDALESLYAPVLYGELDQTTLNNSASQEFPIPVFGQAPAYKEFGLFGTESLGDFDSFTDLAAAGYQAYADVLDAAAAMASGINNLEISRIAANGEAYRWLYHNNQELWGKLYEPDNYRPSEYGTWLLACTLYIAITGKEPPTFDPTGWGWQSNQNAAMPTEIEAEILRKIAIYAMGLSDQPVIAMPTAPPTNPSPTSSPTATKLANNPGISLPGNFDGYDAIPPDVYTKDSIKIAYFGNSFTTRNDCPSVVDQMLKLDYKTVENVQCVQGGNRLDGLAQGRCPEWFETDGSPNPQKWDFVVLQDQSSYPAYLDTRKWSLNSLSVRYAPLLFGTTPGSEQTGKNIHEQFPVPILMQTPAYKVDGLFGTYDLGGFDGMTDKVAEGYQEYADVLDYEAALAAGINDFQISRIAPNGEAYRWLYYNIPDLWAKLYDPDNYHPGMLGTWLLACILYVSMTGKEPPTFNFEWFGRDPERLTEQEAEEAEILRIVAVRIMGL